MVNEMFSLVLPAYNEASRLEKCIAAVRRELSGLDYEIIIAEDGSTDSTDKIAAKLAGKYKNVRHIHHNEKLGKGGAISNAFREARGDEMGTMDVDMAVDAIYLRQLAEYAKKYDVVTASRYVRNAKVARPFAREFVSRSYNFMAKVLLGSKISDLQCGFKAFSRRFVEKEIMNIQERSWAWDTIVLVVAVRKGYSLKEFPVAWAEKKEVSHSSSAKRIFSDICIHGKVLLKLFAKFRLGMDVVL
jgi:hypothetical protein